MVIVIRRCLLLIISLSGLRWSVESRFSEDDIATFLDYIFKLHNLVRAKHGVQELFRTYSMDVIALQKLIEVKNDTVDHEDPLGVSFKRRMYYDSTQLNAAEAMAFFSQSYEQGNFYDYLLEPDDGFSFDFTQIVWGKTTQIGLAFVCERFTYAVQSVYYERGNIPGSYLINVRRPLNNKPVTDDNLPELYYQTRKEKFIDNMLELHNDARTKHGVPLLIHNENMDELANEILRQRSVLTPQYGTNRLGGKYFQRIRLDEKAAAEEFFSTWYNVEKFHNYDSFTQIVWGETQLIGIGIHEEPGNEYEVLVLYMPPANIP